MIQRFFWIIQGNLFNPGNYQQGVGMSGFQTYAVYIFPWRSVIDKRAPFLALRKTIYTFITFEASSGDFIIRR